MKKESKLALLAISGVPLIMVLGNSMLIPVLPAIKNDLHLTQFQVSLVITLFSVPAGLIIPLTGFLSDRFSRKKIIAPSLLLYGIGGLIGGLAAVLLKQNAYPLLLGGRVIQGLGAAGTAPIAMALVGDLFKGKERSKSLGIIEASNGSGKVISPILGAAVGLIAWYATLFLFPLLTVPIAAGVWFLVKEPGTTKKPPSIKEYLDSIKDIFSKKLSTLVSSFFSGMVALLILFGVLFFLSDYLENTLDMFGIIKGLALAVPVLFMATTSYLTGLFIKKKIKLMKYLVVGGLSIIGISLAMLSFNKSLIPFYIFISLAGVGTGLVLPPLNTIITSSTGKDKRGLVTSLYGSVRFLGVAAGPPLFGVLMDISTDAMFWTTAGLGLVSAGLAMTFIKIEDLKDQRQKGASTPKESGQMKKFAFETGTFSNREKEADRGKNQT